jgi:epoxyqueuosine reductase
MKDQGFRASIVPLDRLRELHDEIEVHRKSGYIDPVLDEEYLQSFDQLPPPALPSAASLLIVAARQPRVRMTIERPGGSHPVMVPPTYSNRVDNRLLALLSNELAPHGYNVAPAYVPKKLLAAKSGLAEYGKNNLAYIDGMGSYFRLMTFYSDLPSPHDNWGEPTALPLCGDCTACIKHCPTDAIGAERFLIRAERCLTFHNERTADFPAWIDPSWHHCLIGCMACQDSCPINRKVTAEVEDSVRFTSDETLLLLRGESLEGLPPVKLSALKEFEFLKDRKRLARNLKALLESGTAS